MGIFALLAPFIPTIINAVEGLFKHPDPTVKLGPDKLDAVTQALQQFAGLLVSSKIAPAPAVPVTTDAFHSAIETVLAQMKAEGTLTGTPQAVSASDLYVMRGTPVRIPLP